ncbi:putative lipoprotein [Citreicella sp. SE45]|nr:putative lipoprotein [Citreicella sp. SE45]MAU47029.1 hypothetical protein [Salipiger sp.]
MKFRMIPKLAGALGLVAAVAACSNDPYYNNPFAAGYDVIFGGAGEPTPVTQEQIVQTLTSTDLPTVFLNIPERQSQTLLVRIEQNNGYDTYANAGRQAVIMRNGVIVGTRGFGGDLMSTDAGGVRDLVRGSRTGQATYIQRFLTAEDVTRTVTYRCGVEPDKPVDVSMGLVQGTAREVIAACESADGTPFVNYFVVDGNGDILASRQWLGEELGYVSMHRLRR